MVRPAYLLMMVLGSCLPGPSVGQVYFRDVADQQNLQHDYGTIIPGGGVSWVDFNQDGWDDLTLATIEGQPLRFFLNRTGRLEEVPPLIDNTAETKQVLWADYDNDGDLDLFVAAFADLNRLYRNEGDLRFTEVTLEAGLPLEVFDTYGAVWADFNRDGWLDLYYARRTGIPKNNSFILLINNADGTFSERGAASGASINARVPFTSAALDYNNDGWPDIYSANDRFTGNNLYENIGGGLFRDAGPFSGADIRMNAMSVTVGDYNNDGWLDIYSTNTEQGNVLLHNNGNRTFTERGAEAGVAFYEYCWGALFVDADNDGWQDLYVSGMYPGSEVNSSTFYYNLRNGTFEEPGAGFVGDTTISYNNALGDLNNDGLYDIFVVNAAPFSSQLWRNETQTDHRFLKIKLRGVLSNRDGIGARIEVWTDTLRQTRYTHAGIGFLGQNSFTYIFGLGNFPQADSVVVIWPTGHRDVWTDLQAGQAYDLTEGASTDGIVTTAPDVQIVTATRKAITPSLLSVFPNPATDRLSIPLPPTGRPPFRFQLFNSQGKMMSTGILTDRSFLKMPIDHLPAGLYFLTLTDAQGGEWSARWIKQ